MRRICSLIGLGCILALAASGCDSKAHAETPDAATIPPPFTPANDVEFIDGMVPHHQSAVMMADMVLQRGSRADVKQLAQQIKDSQATEISMMKSIRQQLVGSADTPPMNDQHMMKDMDTMMTLSGADLDMMFLEDMIPHHAQAITMAHRAMANLSNGDLKAMATNIFDSQAQEIGQMQMMRK